MASCIISTCVYRFVHTPEPQYVHMSSVHRTRALATLEGPTDSSSALNILSDTSDTEYPMYRNGASPDVLSTIATVVYDLLRGVAEIYTTQPLPGVTPTYEFNF
eukprot:scpid84639/ scgid15319/ 